MRCWLRDARSARLGSLAVGLALVALTLVGPGAALAAEPAKPAEAVAQTAEKWPMLSDLSLLLGYDVLSSQTGLGNAYDSRDVPTSSLMTGVRLTAWVFDELGFEVEGKYVPTQFEHDTSGKANLFGVRAQGVYRFMTQTSVQPFVSLGGGWDLLSADATALRSKGIYVAPSDWDYTIMAGAGVRWQVMDHLALRVDLRYVLGEARKGTAVGSNFEPMLALAYGIGGKPGDADGDGILDNVDKCPDQAEDKDGFEDQDGCPDPDNDGDKILDTEDKCPNEAEDFDGFEDYDGCPDLDNDKDGIPDTADKCPNEAEDKDGFQDEDGCPDLDNDKDGIPDTKDKCPNQAEDKDGFQDEDGCPDPDNDQDGVLDGADKCPNQPETKNGYKDDDGCPDEVPADLAKIIAGPVQGIVFKGNELNDKASAAALQPVAASLVAHDDVKVLIKLVSATADKAAAQVRADAVKNFLVVRGVEAERIETVTEIAEGAAVAPAPAAAEEQPAKGKKGKPAKKAKAPKKVKGKKGAAEAAPDVVTITLK